jgi:hypothetical protein
MMIIICVKSLKEYSGKKVKEFAEIVRLSNPWRGNNKVSPDM